MHLYMHGRLKHALRFQRLAFTAEAEFIALGIAAKFWDIHRQAALNSHAGRAPRPAGRA